MTQVLHIRWFRLRTDWKKREAAKLFTHTAAAAAANAIRLRNIQPRNYPNSSGRWLKDWWKNWNSKMWYLRSASPSQILHTSKNIHDKIDIYRKFCARFSLSYILLVAFLAFHRYFLPPSSRLRATRLVPECHNTFWIPIKMVKSERHFSVVLVQIL